MFFLKEDQKSKHFYDYFFTLSQIHLLLDFFPTRLLDFSYLSSRHPFVKCCLPTALTVVLLAVYFIPMQLSV